MSDHYHHISPFRPHLRDIFARGFGNVIDRHLAVKIGFILCHDLRRHKADIADAQGVGLTVAVHDPGIWIRYGVNIGLPVLASMILAFT